MTPVLDAAQVHARIPIRRAMDAVQDAFLALGRGEVGDSHSLGITVEGGTFHVKACAAGSGALRAIFVAKVNANFPSNPSERGLPTIQGVIAVFDTTDGRLLMLVDSPSVTNLRTAATSGVAIRHLARAGSRSATVVGCGVQGAAHVAALADALPLERLRLFDVDGAKASGLAARVRRERAIDCAAAASLQAAALASDVVVTCTTATQPFLGIADVKPGTLVVAVGADNERKGEIEPALLDAARLVTDLTSQCAKIGELRQAPGARARICGEMVDVVAGRVARTAAGEIVVFDSSGLAVEDLALCALLLEAADSFP